jgi:hypothetical protein
LFLHKISFVPIYRDVYFTASEAGIVTVFEVGIEQEPTQQFEMFAFQTAESILRFEFLFALAFASDSGFVFVLLPEAEVAAVLSRVAFHH